MSTSALPELPLSAEERRIVALLEAEPPSSSRHCFRSAIDHLRRASLIEHIDPAMAIFRGITAEEEAASGLMHAFIAKRYPNAGLLDPRHHVQKHAVTPFLRSLLHHLAEIKLDGVSELRLALCDVDGKERLVVDFLLEGEGEPQTARPVPPLNLSMSAGQGGKFPDLSRNVHTILDGTSYTNALSFVQAQANLRNRILYAAPDGYPQIEDLKPEYLQECSRRVLTILKTALLILPYDEVQPFATQALDSYLRLIKKLNDNPQTAEA